MVLPLDVTTPRGFYAWSCSALATPLALGKSVFASGTNPYICSLRLFENVKDSYAENINALA